MKPRSLVLVLAVALAASSGGSEADAAPNPILQKIMKRMSAHASAGNLHATAELLSLVKNMGPTEYGGWAATAEKGRAAAAAGNAAGVKASCTGCHDRYRESYKIKYGSSSRRGPIERP